jgi:hypothetical protein
MIKYVKLYVITIIHALLDILASLIKQLKYVCLTLAQQQQIAQLIILAILQIKLVFLLHLCALLQEHKQFAKSGKLVLTPLYVLLHALILVLALLAKLALALLLLLLLTVQILLALLQEK